MYDQMMLFSPDLAELAKLKYTGSLKGLASF